MVSQSAPAMALCTIHAYFQVLDEAKAMSVMKDFIESTKAGGFKHALVACELLRISGLQPSRFLPSL